MDRAIGMELRRLSNLTSRYFEQQANNVRRKSKQLDLNTLMEREGVKRPDEKRRNRQPSAQSAQNVKKE